MEDYKLILDVIVAILLAATIGYAVMLNRRLGELRRNRDDLARLVNAFNDATARAEAGIPKLRRAADDAGATLQERVEKAQTLRDDLAFMIERAEAMAARLEGVVRQARDVKLPPSPAAASGAAMAAQQVRASMSRPPQGAGGQGGNPSAVPGGPVPGMSPHAGHSAHQPMMEPHFGALDDEPFDFDDDRSEAERELLRAMQSVR